MWRCICKCNVPNKGWNQWKADQLHLLYSSGALQSWSSDFQLGESKGSTGAQSSDGILRLSHFMYPPHIDERGYIQSGVSAVMKCLPAPSCVSFNLGSARRRMKEGGAFFINIISNICTQNSLKPNRFLKPVSEMLRRTLLRLWLYMRFLMSWTKDNVQDLTFVLIFWKD